MGKLLIGLVIGLVLGAAGWFFLAGPAMVGAGAGVGIAVGVKTAACIMQEAEGAGIVTAEQRQRIRALAAQEFGAEIPEGESIGGPTGCDEFMAQLREASAK